MITVNRNPVAGRMPRSRALRIFVAIAASTMLIALTGCSASIQDPPASPTITTTAAPGIRPADSSVTAARIFRGGLYVDPLNHAAAAAAGLRSTSGQNGADTAAAQTIEQISSVPTAIWLGDQISTADLKPLLENYVAAGRAAGKTLVFVLYAIPNRDCGGLSAGGLSAADYATWSQTIATALAGSHSVALVEPDSLAMLTEKKCASEVSTRPALIRSTVDKLVRAGLTVYLDGGNSHWVAPKTMARLLESAGIAESRGFFTNVSNFYRVDQERAYGQNVSKLVSGKHFVVDVSRNGNGWKGTWCNPTGAAIGQHPAVTSRGSSLDALLWVKHPGDSDGTCNGGPKAGVWWQQYALDLVNNRH